MQNLPYTAMHLGWAWVTVPATSMGRNLIENNRVANIMKDLNDGGCIYLLGPQSGDKDYSVIRGNYVSGCSNQGIYFDEGSNFYHVMDNVTAGIGDNIIKIAGKKDKSDIDIVRTYAQKPLPVYECPRIEAEPAIIAVKNDWPAPAKDIMEKAGLEPAYRDIKPAPTPKP
jgi:hypothetical protein